MHLGEAFAISRDRSENQAVEWSNLGIIVCEWREALGLSQSRLAHFCSLSRQTLVGLEAGAHRDLGITRVAQLLQVVELDLDSPIQAERSPEARLVDGGEERCSGQCP